MLDADIRMMSERSEALHQIIMNLLTWRRFVDDEFFIRELVPLYLSLPGQMVFLWEYGEHTLGPKRYYFTIEPIAFSRHKGDIES